MNIFSKVTLRSLRKNPIRTTVTIIGIILSAAMMMAVTTSITSLQSFLYEGAIRLEGDWMGAFEMMPAADMPKLEADSLVESVQYVQNIGYAEEDTGSTESPYLYIMGAEENFFERMPIQILQGRLPENSNELMLPEHLLKRSEKEFTLGMSLTLDVGARTFSGETLTQRNEYIYADENGVGEVLEPHETRTYTVVGIYARPTYTIEGTYAPGYTAITYWNQEDTTAPVNAYFNLSQPKAVYDFTSGIEINGEAHYYSDTGSAINGEVLRAIGVSRYDNFYRVLNSLAAILIIIIMFGSISLIYNAFSISVSERTKQFGLLSSVGATRRQVRTMVFSEAMFVSIIGIPLGILSGILGLGVTFHFIGGKFDSIIESGGAGLRLVVSPAAAGIAAAVAFVTVLISAWVPSGRAMRVSAIEAIRQSADINIKNRDVKTSKLTYRLFGLEGMLAQKHYKRNRRRYRTTVLSLFMSIVLFVSASSFCTYLTDSVTVAYDSYDFDVSYQWREKADGEGASLKENLARFSALDGVEQMSGYLSYYGDIQLTGAQIPPETVPYLEEYQNMENGLYRTSFTLIGVDEVTYRSYLASLNLDPAEYLDTDTPKAIVTRLQRGFNYSTERIESMQMLTDEVQTLQLALIDETRAYEELEGEEEISSEERDALLACYTQILEVTVGAYSEELPLGWESSEQFGIKVLFPQEYLDQQSQILFNKEIYFDTPNSAELAAAVEEMTLGDSLFYQGVYDANKDQEGSRNTITIIKVFSYGFITLISLISLANVFNTISTNLMLRRREFAMLKSVGMAQGGFRRMMNFESLLYGVKSVLYGLPVAVFMTYLIYRSIGFGMDTGFYLPWTAVAIAVGSVFLVVSATMLYGMRKISRENPIDALKRENL